MQVPEEILSWDGVEQLWAEIARSGFRLPDRYLALTAARAGKSEAEWREEVRVHARAYIRTGGGDRNPELVRIQREEVLDPAFREVVIKRVREWREGEVQPDPRYLVDWVNKKAHLRKVAQQMARAEGFDVTKEGYRIDMGRDLRLEVSVDVGRRGSEIMQVVTYNALRATEGNWKMPLWWDYVYPGLRAYADGSNSASLVWGIKAFVTAGKALALTMA